MNVRGVVDTYGKNFGFISHQDSGRQHRVFFTANSIRLDSIGRRGHSTFVGALVRFKIDHVVHKGQPRTIAADVHPVFEEELSISIEDHREVSQVARINPGQRSVWLRREDGSEIFLHKEQVTPEHLERFLNELLVNDYVFHGIRNNGDDKWGATVAEIFSREENDKLQRGESLDMEPQQPEPAPVVETAPEFLAPHNKSKTFLQLALERKLRQ